jgi:hypothetical protein
VSGQGSAFGMAAAYTLAGELVHIDAKGNLRAMAETGHQADRGGSYASKLIVFGPIAVLSADLQVFAS